MKLDRITLSIERELKRHFDLSLAEYDIFMRLASEPRRPKALCVLTDASASAVSRWLTRLVRERWVSRKYLDHNRSEFEAHITRRGRNQLRRIGEHLAGALRPMADVLTPEDERLIRRLEDNMRRLLK